jgi:hypothetical protein
MIDEFVRPSATVVTRTTADRGGTAPYRSVLLDGETHVNKNLNLVLISQAITHSTAVFDQTERTMQRGNRKGGGVRHRMWDRGHVVTFCTGCAAARDAPTLR